MSAQYKRQLHSLVQQYYASTVLRNGSGSGAAISQFIQCAKDPDFLAYAKAEMLRMSKLGRRDFVSSLGAEFIRNAIDKL
jgi:hypothetical protein